MSADLRSQVLQAVDLVDLVRQTVALKRQGRNYVGLCPFHQERTPSFTVNPVRQTFYCFGCKAGGTAFDFVMRRDRVEFREAMEILARSAGIELPKVGIHRQPPGQRQMLLEANSAACRFFENLLWQQSTGSVALEYLRRRGFQEETLRRFRIGLAADSWDALLKGPVGRKFPGEVLAQAGLVKPREHGGGFYDTFRNRIMFPIFNEAGQIVAFGGRVMPGSDDPAKYLNSPEGPLFSKSRAVFGLHLARQRIVETRTAVVVEGYLDSVMAHQCGAGNVVSVLGTSLTDPQVSILRRFADRIVLVFDADRAGEAAAERVLQLYLGQPLEIAVATMPGGLDPDDFLLTHGLEAFERLVAEAPDALTYAWKLMRQRFVSSNGLTEQQKAVAEYVDLLAKASLAGPVDGLRLGAALARASRLTEVPLAELHRRCRPKRSGRRQAVAVAAGPLSGVRGARDLSERWILGALLLEPRRWQDLQGRVSPQDMLDPGRRELAELYWKHQQARQVLVFSEFLAEMEDERSRSLAIELVEEAEKLSDLDQRVEGALQHLAELRRSEEGQAVLAALMRAREQPLTAEQENELLRKVAEIKARPDVRSVGPAVG